MKLPLNCFRSGKQVLVNFLTQSKTMSFHIFKGYTFNSYVTSLEWVFFFLYLILNSSILIQLQSNNFNKWYLRALMKPCDVTSTFHIFIFLLRQGEREGDLKISSHSNISITQGNHRSQQPTPTRSITYGNTKPTRSNNMNSTPPIPKKGSCLTRHTDKKSNWLYYKYNSLRPKKNCLIWQVKLFKIVALLPCTCFKMH